MFTARNEGNPIIYCKSVLHSDSADMEVGPNLDFGKLSEKDEPNLGFDKLCVEDELNLDFDRLYKKGLQVKVKATLHNFVSKDSFLNLLKPTCYVMHQQFNIQQLYVLPTLY